MYAISNKRTLFPWIPFMDGKTKNEKNEREKNREIVENESWFESEWFLNAKSVIFASSSEYKTIFFLCLCFAFFWFLFIFHFKHYECMCCFVHQWNNLAHMMHMVLNLFCFYLLYPFLSSYSAPIHFFPSSLMPICFSVWRFVCWFYCSGFEKHATQNVCEWEKENKKIFTCFILLFAPSRAYNIQHSPSYFIHISVVLFANDRNSKKI